MSRSCRRLLVFLVPLTGCDAAPDPAAAPLPPGGKGDHALLGSACLNDDDFFEELGLEEGTDLGFRWQSPERPGELGRCVNEQGEEGLNPACLGECGDLRGRDLTNWDIQWWWMMGIDFTDANIPKIKLRNAQLAGAKFRGANMKGADLTYGYFEYADFTDAALFDTYMGFSHVTGAVFHRADLTSSFWSITKAFDADFRGARMGSMGFQYMHSCGIGETTSCMKGSLYSDTTVLPFHPDKVDYYGLVKQDDPSDLPAGETYSLVADGELCADGAGDGAVAVAACDHGDSQSWRFATSEGGAFRIYNIGSELCLEVENGSSEDGAVIRQAGCTGGDRQRWEVDVDGDRVSLINKRSGSCAEVDASGAVTQAVCDGGAGQRWERLLRL